MIKGRGWRLVVPEAGQEEQRRRWHLMVDQIPADDPIRLAMADYYARAKRVLERWGGIGPEGPGAA